MNVERLIRAYLKMRDTLNERKREYDEYKKGIEAQMEKIEQGLHRHLDQTGLTDFSKKGVGTAFLTTKDSVSVTDGEVFRKFLCEKMLMMLQPHMYKDVNGSMRSDGQEVLEEHILSMLNSGAFDLLSTSAHKANTKQYMLQNDGKLPPGLEYTKELVVQVRKK